MIAFSFLAYPFLAQEGKMGVDVANLSPKAICVQLVDKWGERRDTFKVETGQRFPLTAEGDPTKCVLTFIDPLNGKILLTHRVQKNERSGDSFLIQYR